MRVFFNISRENHRCLGNEYSYLDFLDKLLKIVIIRQNKTSYTKEINRSKNIIIDISVLVPVLMIGCLLRLRFRLLQCLVTLEFDD